MSIQHLGIFILIFFTPLSWAQRSCLPTQNALQVFEVLTPNQSLKKTYPLYEGMEHRPWLETVMEYNIRKTNQLQLTFQFEERFKGVSLPYNLYAIMIVSGGSVLAWMDFTNECLSPGLSFFPGQHIEIPLGRVPDFDTPQSLQIMVWGRM